MAPKTNVKNFIKTLASDEWQKMFRNYKIVLKRKSESMSSKKASKLIPLDEWYLIYLTVGFTFFSQYVLWESWE